MSYNAVKMLDLLLLQLLFVVGVSISQGLAYPEPAIVVAEPLRAATPKQPCPCVSELLCMPLAQAREQYPAAPHVQRYTDKLQKKDVFAFVLKCDAGVWSKFDWSKLTTVALVGFYDPDLFCHAHQHGTRVVNLGNIPTSQLPNATARHLWVQLQVSNAALKSLDGLNIDFEDAIQPGTPEQDGLTQLVKETVEEFHARIPGSQVSVDVAWSARGIDDRFYDYKAIAAHSDLIFIMAYDEQSQILHGSCTARPNAGIYMTAKGLRTYMALGIPVNKMVLGVPWYGYNYPCVKVDQDGTCFIQEVPFRGVNCSDAAGKEYPFSYMLSTLKQHNATYHWDTGSLTPWYNFEEDGVQRQMRYDDENSLMYKYMLAVMSGLRGVGMWTANFLDYTDNPDAIFHQKLMWSLLP